MRIALAGNPNSGKTTMYNALTGRNERVGNWAGVTVEKKEHPIKKHFYEGEDLIAVDLPGAYSMSPFTSEESITSAYVSGEHPDVIINIVDATNLSRSLFFTTQLLELGIPMVVALNKSDINQKRQTRIDPEKLSKLLGCPVIQTISTTSSGLEALVRTAAERRGTTQTPPYRQAEVDSSDRQAVKQADKARFEFVDQIVRQVEERKVLTRERTWQDKLDDVLTNRWLGIPIFAVVMFLVFDISQSSLGPWLADTLVGWIEVFQGWVANLTEGASPLLQALLIDGVIGGVSAVIGFLPLVMVMYFLIALLEDCGYMARVSIGGVSAVIGFLPLVMVMYFLIALLEDCGYMARVSVVLDPIFKKVGLSGKSVIPFIIGTGCAIPGIMACRTIRSEQERRATAMLTPFMPCGAKLPVIALFAGVFFSDASWVGTLMYFVGILLIFLGALLVNRISGYSGRRSFFIALFAGVFFSDASWVGTLMYFVGILLIFLGALLVNRISGYSGRRSFFIMELPEYKLPSLKRAFGSMCSRGWAYIVKAGTIILLCSTAVQIMQSFDWNFQVVAEGMEHTSILASIASPFAVLLIPLGFGVWQMAAAAITGFIAKENVVSTLAVCYGVTNFIDIEEKVLIGGAPQVAAIFHLTKAAALACLMFNLFTPPCFAAIGAMNSEIRDRKWLFGGIALQLGTGYTIAFAVYQIGTLITEGPCFAAIGAMNSEIRDRKWLFGGIALQLGTGYTIAFAVYQIGTLITEGTVGAGFLPGLAAVAAMIAFVTYLCLRTEKEPQTVSPLSRKEN